MQTKILQLNQVFLNELWMHNMSCLQYGSAWIDWRGKFGRQKYVFKVSNSFGRNGDAGWEKFIKS